MDSKTTTRGGLTRGSLVDSDFDTVYKAAMDSKTTTRGGVVDSVRDPDGS